MWWMEWGMMVLCAHTDDGHVVVKDFWEGLFLDLCHEIHDFALMET